MYFVSIAEVKLSNQICNFFLHQENFLLISNHLCKGIESDYTGGIKEVSLSITLHMGAQDAQN